MLERDLNDTASQLGKDAAAYRRLYSPFVAGWDSLRHDLLKPIGWPRHPIAMARFGLLGLRSARAIADGYFKGARARALFAGLAAHSFLPLESPTLRFLWAGAGNHRRTPSGWPIPQGGAQSIADALVSLPEESWRHGYHQRARALAAGAGPRRSNTPGCHPQAATEHWR